MKKRYAAHQVVTTDGHRCKQFVVELEENAVTRIFPLTEEIAFTEWIGGMIILSPICREEIKQIDFPIPIETLLFTLTRHTDRQICYAWHISPEEVSTGIVHALRQL